MQNVSKEKEFSALQASVHRAEKLASELVKHAGGPNERMLTNSKIVTETNVEATRSGEKKHSILVVDDEQITLALVSRILTEAGYKVTTAQSGFECLDHVRRNPYEFSLVLLDFSMPFMDGEETFNRLREIRRDLLVVICTGFIHQERLQRLMESGLAGFLRKPLAPVEIVDHIRAILDSTRYSHSRVDPNRLPAAG